MTMMIIYDYYDYGNDNDETHDDNDDYTGGLTTAASP